MIVKKYEGGLIMDQQILTIFIAIIGGIITGIITAAFMYIHWVNANMIQYMRYIFSKEIAPEIMEIICNMINVVCKEAASKTANGFIDSLEKFTAEMSEECNNINSSTKEENK